MEVILVLLLARVGVDIVLVIFVHSLPLCHICFNNTNNINTAILQEHLPLLWHGYLHKHNVVSSESFIKKMQPTMWIT